MNIVDSYLNIDREYDLSIADFAVQLFTVPTIAQYNIFSSHLADISLRKHPFLQSSAALSSLFI